MTAYPEVELLALVLGDTAARKVSDVPGGWRSLSPTELDALRLRPKAKQTVMALQRLASPVSSLPQTGFMGSPEDVVAAFGARLAVLEHEIVIAWRSTVAIASSGISRWRAAAGMVRRWFRQMCCAH